MRYIKKYNESQNTLIPIKIGNVLVAVEGKL